jgi:16S rRNA (uracil1498-N3)-methyltransferase
MSRRFHIPILAEGLVQLDQAQSRHLRNVLRLKAGEDVELFDSAGHTAPARVVALEPLVQLQVAAVHAPPTSGPVLSVAAAVPKGARADWMIEKLSELGVHTFIPLETARTVVHPESGKLARWERLARESAKQCHRADVLRLAEPSWLEQVLETWQNDAWCLSTQGDSQPVFELAGSLNQPLLALVGPEGGWTDGELELMRQQPCRFVRLTPTVLRVETAAITIAAIVLSRT